MPSRRVQKAAQAVREAVSMAILADLKDPRVQDVTVTYVEVSGDMRHAKVHVSVMGDETKQSLCLRGLQNSAGYLQTKLGKRIESRYTPRLEFILDQGVKKSIEISKILDRVLPAKDKLDDSDPATVEPEQDDPAPAEDNSAEDNAAEDDSEQTD